MSLIGSDISSYMYLSMSQVSFLLNQGLYLPWPADVLLFVPDGERLNLEIDGLNYQTSALILDDGAFSGEGQSGRGGSLLDNTGLMSMRFMEEIDDFIEDAGLELEAKNDGVTLDLIQGIGIDLEGDEGVEVDSDDIRNDFLRTIEVDRKSNRFSDSP